MSKITKRWLVLGIFFTLFLSGCKCSDDQINIMDLINDSPLAGEVISTLLPTLSFHNSESCQPDEYKIQLSDNSDYGWSANYTTLDDSPSYTLTNPLYAGKEYVWNVRAHKNSYGNSSYSERTFFYTGPICSGETLIAPDLQNPDVAGWVEEEYEFTWTYNGGCLPISYEVQFSRDAAFTDIYLTANTADPYAQHLLMAFPDCSSLFWRVRAFDGTTFGPWSEGRDFHYILSQGCYQWHYLSDDFAWLSVRLERDYCSQTGYISATTQSLDYGCVAENMYIVGDGSYAGPISDFVVDLGAGPCPSTGLDQKTAEWDAKFGVLTPGTYCVSINRNQTAGNNNQYNLMDGIWTEPRVNAIVAEKTIELGPGTHNLIVNFNWDEIDRKFLTIPLNFTYDCKIGPEKGCPTYDFAREGETIPIFARDTNSEYKLTEINGFPCYLYLSNAAINEALGMYDGVDWRAEDLEFFPQPDPCATPTPEPRQKTCSAYGTRTECNAHNAEGCVWAGSTDSCVGP